MPGDRRVRVARNDRPAAYEMSRIAEGIHNDAVRTSELSSLARLHLNDLADQLGREARGLDIRRIELRRAVGLQSQLRRALDDSIAVEIAVLNRSGIIDERCPRIVELTDELQLARRATTIDPVAFHVQL